MNFVALRMLMGDKAKYLGIIFGIAFASLLMTQQLAIFVGLMSRTFGFVTDTGQPSVWVMDPKVQFIDDLKPLQDTMLYRVRFENEYNASAPAQDVTVTIQLDSDLDWGTFQFVDYGFGAARIPIAGGSDLYGSRSSEHELDYVFTRTDAAYAEDRDFHGL